MKNSNEENENTNKNKKFIFDIPSVFMQSRTIQIKDNQNADDILSDVEYKKIVVYIYGKENIEHIDSISVEERNNLINEIIVVSRLKSFLQIKKELIKTYTKQLVVFVILVAILVPLLLIIINTSYQYTKSSYKTQEANFQKLFDSKERPIAPQYQKREQYEYQP